MKERDRLIEDYKKLDWGCNAFVEYVLAERKNTIARVKSFIMNADNPLLSPSNRVGLVNAIDKLNKA